MKVTAVIGVWFGDEGKGHMTDYFSTPAGLVIRFNGGAQAGHTVVTPDGQRHVFHHFGSGTLRGAATYLSKYFICNPMLFAKEYKELQKAGLSPKVFIDPRCRLTTPYDMLINELAERSRGKMRHGSCGCGIHETVLRSEKEYELTVGFSNVSEKVLTQIVNEYVPTRLQQLGISERDIPAKYKGFFRNKNVVKRYVDDYNFMNKYVEAMGFIRFYNYDSIVFEGAQGLCLDQDNSRYFPYLTHSHTGMKNVRQIAGEIGIKDIETVYVTRCYVTRHGRGPLLMECDKPYKGIMDDTNVHNEFQEGLRFALFNTPDFHKNIIDDVSAEDLPKSIAVTCLDQADDMVTWCNGRICKKKDFIGTIASGLRIKNLYECWGPTREDVKRL